LIYGIILAGGRGERFWPLSRAHRPKQLLKLISERTMLQETIDRILPLISIEQIIVVTSEDMKEPILREIDILSEKNILAEPDGRNTCLAIGLAAEHLKKIDPKAVMVVLSADHIVKPPQKLIEIIKVGAEIASEEDRLITIGIDPTRAETGYGYIKLADSYKVVGGISVYEVDSFTEKPKPVVAQQYYLSHEHLWNSGMFIWSVKAILDAIKHCKRPMSQALKSYSEKIGSVEEIPARANLYKECEPISIDFAVLEDAENVLAIKGDLIWDDVGSWNALERYKAKNHEHNVIIGEARVCDSFETTIYNDGEGIIVSLGVSDLVVVKTDDIVLVAHKTKVNDVKKILKEFASDKNLSKFL